MNEFSILNTKDYDLSRVQSEVKRVVDPLSKNPMAYGILFKDVSLLSAMTNQLEHKLNRVWNGYLITKCNAGAVVFFDDMSSLDKKFFLSLKTTLDCKVDIYIY